MSDALATVIGGALVALLAHLTARATLAQQSKRESAEQRRLDEIAGAEQRRLDGEAQVRLAAERVALEERLYARTRSELDAMQHTIDSLRASLIHAEEQIDKLTDQVRVLERERDDWREKYEAVAAAAASAARTPTAPQPKTRRR